MLGKPVVEENASRALNTLLTLSNVFNLVGPEIDELTKWKPGPGATKQRDPERAYSDEHTILDPSGESTGERFSSDAGARTVDPERVADDEVVEEDEINPERAQQAGEFIDALGPPIDINKISDIEWEDIDHGDYPDYSDAFISSAQFEHAPGQFRDLTDDELETLQDEHSEWAYEKLQDTIH